MVKMRGVSNEQKAAVPVEQEVKETAPEPKEAPKEGMEI